MPEPLPRGFARAPVAARDWWNSLTADAKWADLGPLFQHHCVEILRLRCDLAVAQSPVERVRLAKEVRQSEVALGLWQERRERPARKPTRERKRPGSHIDTDVLR